jgi:hypothetical protein
MREPSRGLAGVPVLCLLLSGLASITASAQPAPDARPVTLSGRFDVANAYVLRGILQDDTGVIMWPAAELGVTVKPGNQRGTGRMTVTMGTWNSLHTGAAGLDGLGKLWYQSDFYAGFAAGIGAGLSVGTTYLARTSPNSAFPSVTELIVNVGAPASWVSPYALVAFELQGQLDGGRSKGTYLELGARPMVGRRFTLAMPTKVGLSLGDYYEGLQGDETFGFFSIGGVASLLLGDGARTGAWNVHGGAEYTRFGERNQLVSGKTQQVVVSGGIGLSY